MRGTQVKGQNVCRKFPVEKESSKKNQWSILYIKKFDLTPVQSVFFLSKPDPPHHPSVCVVQNSLLVSCAGLANHLVANVKHAVFFL